MKKRKVFIIFLVSLIIFVFGYYLAFNQNKYVSYNDETKQFVHTDTSKIMENLVNRQQGIYYFGFPTCPWCLELLPILDKELEKESMNAYAVNTRGDDYTENDDELLQKFYKKYTGDESLSVPFIVAINNKKEVQVHIGTVKNHDATKTKLKRRQKEELSQSLNEMLIFSESE
ncbi:TPA: transporter [Enterococcus faecalis]|nr:transporter [Enterococcus faecalis]HEM7728975.1 transporter [Enterococcus faecalis]